jgi:hypothetical protein
MRIPRHWVRVEGDTPADYEGPRRIAVWGWSGTSVADAERVGYQRLTAVLDRLRQGLGLPHGYEYGARPLREQILEEITTHGGEPDAVVTRNSYGSVVLNTSRVLFVDVDVPPPTFSQRIAALFGSRGSSPEALVLARIRQALSGGSGSYRLYRTAAGFRVIGSDPLVEPRSPVAEQTMRALGADPAFVHLCRVQGSYRARLTPKPWRCGQPNPPGTFPRDPEEEALFVAWLASYERAAAARSTCGFVEAIGWGRTHPDAKRLVDLHDRVTKTAAELPLA